MLCLSRNPTQGEPFAGQEPEESGVAPPMKSAVKIAPQQVTDIPVQEASQDIWDKKCRLKAKDGTVIDESVDDTWKRVARSLAEVEAPEIREHWYGEFLWALRRGAIPAGRITSNAGALEHKPATST